MTEFEKYYQSEEIAGEYDELRFSGQGGEFIDHLEQHTVLSGLPAPDAGRILEIGCGTGRVTRTMLERGYDVLSVDPSAEMLDLARQRLADLDEGVRQRGELQIGNGFDLGGLPSTFAGALSLRVLIHMKLADVDRVLKQVYPRLESGGRFCFDTLSPWSPNLMIWPINLFRDTFSRATFLPPGRVKQVIKDNGFTLEKVDRKFVVPQFLFRTLKFGVAPLMSINRSLERVVPALAGHYFWTISRS